RQLRRARAGRRRARRQPPAGPRRAPSPLTVRDADLRVVPHRETSGTFRTRRPYHRGMSYSGILRFPHPVIEKAARTVAAGVVVLAVLVLATQWFWLLVPLAYGFVARVLTGPTLSPLGQLATRVVAPRLGEP